ncbi:conserved exported hypothetical protein [Vibrio jasicida]|uniref:hypothetical protein n=1 Tax=Vibrio TaxID=662 RepID=UPI0016406A8A|nr:MULTISPECIES: hypothetical protein [Vibrio]MCF6450502.1 hypothetical protein [Vibrio sp. MMG023]CAH1525070.1 conserved exported hypothetical protein [Vibrio jasicida]
MKFAQLSPLAILCAVSLTACGGSDSSSKTSKTTTPPAPVLSTVIIPNVVSTAFPTELKVAADAGFTHYVKISLSEANNDDAFHIVAVDDGVNNEKIFRAAKIIQHLLTTQPNSKYGTDKSRIAKTLAARDATLMLTKNDDQNDEMLTKIFVSELIRQGKLNHAIADSGLTHTFDTSSLEKFVEDMMALSEEDLDSLVDSIATTLMNSADTPNWLMNSQSLMYRELTVEGDCHYMSNFADYCANLGEHADRDAAFEEILHLVQAQGIAPNASTTSLQNGIQAHALSIYSDMQAGKPTVWRPTQRDWEDWESDDFDPERVKKTGPSYSHEYFAAAFEAYMGVAKANGQGLDGYQALTREEMQSQDPQAVDWISGLFHGYLQYTANIDSAGVKLYTEKTNPGTVPTFRMAPNKDDLVEAYTYKSQWLTRVKIVGDQAINVIGNDQDNTFEGNNKDNSIYGEGGINTYIVPHKLAECIVIKAKNVTVECPSTGSDELYDIQNIKFTDKTLDVTKL